VDPLLRWYEKSHRQLPWRGQVTAYEVLVSEFMLQQTRVTAALPFYERFLARFPTIEALAAAEESEVLAVWQGLGYYARARNLLASARIIARDGLPTAVEGFRALPGVGDYSAAALGGRLLGLPTPSIDGNVERVVARLFGLEGLPAKNPTRSEIRRLATERIDRKRPGDWNQAMMELGATVCLPGVGDEGDRSHPR
jgi:A/G-specific adenine glycosylase